MLPSNRSVPFVNRLLFDYNRLKSDEKMDRHHVWGKRERVDQRTTEQKWAPTDSTDCFFTWDMFQVGQTNSNLLIGMWLRNRNKKRSPLTVKSLSWHFSMNSKPNNFHVPFRLTMTDCGQMFRWIILHDEWRKFNASANCNIPYLISNSKNWYARTSFETICGNRSSRDPNMLARLPNTGSVAKASVSLVSSIAWISVKILGCLNRSNCRAEMRKSSEMVSFRFGLWIFSAIFLSNTNTEASCFRDDISLSLMNIRDFRERTYQNHGTCKNNLSINESIHSGVTLFEATAFIEKTARLYNNEAFTWVKWSDASIPPLHQWITVWMGLVKHYFTCCKLFSPLPFHHKR